MTTPQTDEARQLLKEIGKDALTTVGAHLAQQGLHEIDSRIPAPNGDLASAVQDFGFKVNDTLIDHTIRNPMMQQTMHQINDQVQQQVSNPTPVYVPDPTPVYVPDPTPVPVYVPDPTPVYNYNPPVYNPVSYDYGGYGGGYGGYGGGYGGYDGGGGYY
jgi:hypothetical protein